MKLDDLLKLLSNKKEDGFLKIPGILFSWHRVMAVMSITESSFEVTS